MLSIFIQSAMVIAKNKTDCVFAQLLKPKRLGRCPELKRLRYCSTCHHGLSLMTEKLTDCVIDQRFAPYTLGSFSEILSIALLLGVLPHVLRLITVNQPVA